ncbi:transglycosylase SLT domain-containing protein [Pseudosulfitobacter sp. DSM 107133]|uniref:transglycosylase SLT domain-containing protein n=1 Tax=Pseudosulfitobacter sp. DSM 107133 TaxID=2883100 RepID=UPI000DF3AB0D|nr:transglycosylase SLT domain-containing protein [Pseudosulfitobacter sp. DSM 107133]UOA28812.1 hypothetical protein DSM107133_03570 [Pseudosulfitobacter sp. DSM 107133]
MSLITITSWRAFLAILLCLAWLGSSAGANTQTICDDAAAKVAAESEVPLPVLRAITRVETGRTRNGITVPWPWTVNMEGVGKWFETEDAARAYVFKRFKSGARSFDVGCFQINYKWHGHAFASIEEMFDPLANTRYAAQFLSALHLELGSWSKAAGAYHSRTKEFADKYVKRFDSVHAVLASQAPPLQSIHAGNDETNGFPLLVQTGQAARLGSLVPLVHGSDARPFALFRRGG